MRGQSRQFCIRVLACCVVVGAAGAAGLAAGLTLRSGQVSEHARLDIDLTAAEAIAFRFPNDWAEVAEANPSESVVAAEDQATPSPVPARYAVASASSVPVILNSKPMHEPVTLPPAEAAGVPPWAEAALPPLPRVRPAAAPKSGSPAATVASAEPAATPVKHAAVAHKPPKSNAVLNGAQIASIKRRLNLTPDQERYWPAVEAELRKMEYKKDPKGNTRTASIDTSKMDVEGLRTAGFPLVMSFRDDQRRELKSLAHLLGLEGAMSGL
jgi:hypothetical protein